MVTSKALSAAQSMMKRAELIWAWALQPRLADRRVT
jgi:hypothetical protein